MQTLEAILHYVQVHPVRAAVVVSGLLLLGALATYFLRPSSGSSKPRRKPPKRKRSATNSGKRLAKLAREPRHRPAKNSARQRYLRPALTLAGVLSLAAIGLAVAYRGYTDRLVEEEALPAAYEPTQTFGIDVSHYQAKVNWSAVARSDHPIKFVFLRATMGVDGRDERFRENWSATRRHGFVRGAYHYFRPGEDAETQFLNFANAVELESGDLYPVLDIEERTRRGDAYLRRELQRWLDLAEAHYGVKPIIYSGQSFYQDYLAGHFDAYPLWVAHYSDTPDTAALDWRFHQFTDKVRVRGILTRVDGNNFRGRLRDLEALRVR